MRACFARADIGRFAQMVLGGGSAGGVRVLSAESAALLLRAEPLAGGKRSLAFEVKDEGLGHTGFTGTSLWLDPREELALVILTSRLHPDEKGDVAGLRVALRQLVREVPGDAARAAAVQTGIDVLAAEGFARLRGRRVGLLANTASRSASGRSTVELLQHAAGVALVALFSPEHGLAANAEGNVAGARDPASGLPIHSLYGERRRPSSADLAGIDTLVIDLPDAGARFYTYATTTGYLLEEAQKRGIRVVVLDRPNPLGGERVDGPMLEAGRESFIAYHRIPLQHGMTIGELARLFAAERTIAVDLEVVAMTGYRRAMRFDDTGLRWTPPSPNLRTSRAALLYPGVALLEATNVSVGRGTAAPFEWIGAPWIDGEKLAAALDRAGLAGVTFVAEERTPRASVHAGKRCGGVAVVVRDARAIEPVRIGIEIARQLVSLHAGDFASAGLVTMLGNAASARAIVSGESREAVVAAWATELEEFRRRREPFLLYR